MLAELIARYSTSYCALTIVCDSTFLVHISMVLVHISIVLSHSWTVLQRHSFVRQSLLMLQWLSLVLQQSSLVLRRSSLVILWALLMIRRTILHLDAGVKILCRVHWYENNLYAKVFARCYCKTLVEGFGRAVRIQCLAQWCCKNGRK